MSPLAAALFLLSGLVIYLALAGRLPAVWAALQGQGRSAATSTAATAGSLAGHTATPS